MPNKPSNFSVRSSLRGLQFLVTRRRPPPPSPRSLNRSFFLTLSLFQFLSRPNLPHSFHPCTHVEYRATCDRYSEREAESFADRSRAEETLPTFLLLLFVQPSPTLSLSPLFSPLRHQFFFLPPFSTPLTFAPSQLSSSARSFPIHHSFRPPVIADFYPRLHRSNPSLLFPLPLLAPSALCSCVSMQSRPRIPRFLPTGYRSPRTGRSKQRNDAPSPPLLLPPFAELSVDRRFFAQLRGNRGYNIKWKSEILSWVFYLMLVFHSGIMKFWNFFFFRNLRQTSQILFERFEGINKSRKIKERKMEMSNYPLLHFEISLLLDRECLCTMSMQKVDMKFVQKLYEYV